MWLTKLLPLLKIAVLCVECVTLRLDQPYVLPSCQSIAIVAFVYEGHAAIFFFQKANSKRATIDQKDIKCEAWFFPYFPHHLSEGIQNH